jgi:DNA-binding LytR/AlgR family response regulator
MVTTNLGTLEKTLPENSFFRISRSVIINTSYLKKVSRKKRLAYLVKDGKEYTFKIPLINIRKLERFLEKQ